jgi:hypothetical protein
LVCRTATGGHKYDLDADLTAARTWPFRAITVVVGGISPLEEIAAFNTPCQQVLHSAASLPICVAARSLRYLNVYTNQVEGTAR